MHLKFDLTQGFWGTLRSWYEQSQLFAPIGEFDGDWIFIVALLFFVYWGGAIMLYASGKLASSRRATYERNIEKYRSTTCKLVDSIEKKRKGVSFWRATYEATINGRERLFRGRFSEAPQPEACVHYRPGRRAAWVEGDVTDRSKLVAYLVFLTPWIIIVTPIVLFIISVYIRMIMKA